MAITQAQADKAWQDSPSTATPILAADLKAVSKHNRDLRWMAPTSGSVIPAVVATATSSQGGNPGAAFDGNPAVDFEATSAAVPQYLQAQLTTALAVTTYSIAPRAGWYDQAPKDWTLQGSTDGTTFTVLDTRTGVIFTTDAAVSFTLTNSTAYPYYRLNVTAINGSGTRMSIGEMTLAGRGSSSSIDEFDNDSIDPAWVRVDGTGALAANATWTEGGDVMSVYQAGGDAASTIRGLMRPLSTLGGAPAVGDAFVTCLRLAGPHALLTLGGVVLADGVTFGSGGQVFAAGYIDTVGAPALSFSTFGATSWAGAATGGSPADYIRGETFHLRIVKTGASTWRTDASPDGVSWLLGTTTVTKTLTPTHVGLASSSWGTSTKAVVSYDYLRRVSGVS